MNYSVKFYPEKRNGITKNVPVILSVSWSGNRLFYYTGRRCNIDDDPAKSQWNAEKNELKRNQVAHDGKTSVRFNNDLTKIRASVNDLFELYSVSKLTPSVSQLRNDLKLKLGKEIKPNPAYGFFKSFDQYITDGRQSENRKKCIRTVYNCMKIYAPDVTFDSLNVKDFKQYLIDQKMSSNSIVEYLSKLRAFINWANKEKLTTVKSFDGFDVGSGIYGEPVYITVAERDILFYANIEDKFFSEIRDIFVLQCLLGCRYGDLMRFRKSNILDGCLQYINEKTKKEQTRVIKVPLCDKAKTIISRYNLPDDRLVPFIWLYYFNINVKTLFKDLKINRKVSIRDNETGLEVQVEICDIVSSHMARRCFIGGMHKKGVRNEIIASMSGHVKDSKAFVRYYAIDNEEQEAAMKLIE